MYAWITVDKPSREHIFSHFLCHCKGISLAAREGSNSSRKYRNDKNILMTHLFCSVSWSCVTPCNPMDCSMPGFPVHLQLPELAQTHVHWVSDAIQPCHPLLTPSPPTFILSQHQDLFKCEFFTSGGQSIGASASASVLPMNIQDWFLSGWTGWISLQFKDFQESSTTPQFQSIDSLVLIFLYSPTLTSIHDHWKTHSFD